MLVDWAVGLCVCVRVCESLAAAVLAWGCCFQTVVLSIDFRARVACLVGGGLGVIFTPSSLASKKGRNKRRAGAERAHRAEIWHGHHSSFSLGPGLYPIVNSCCEVCVVCVCVMLCGHMRSHTFRYSGAECERMGSVFEGEIADAYSSMYM